MEKENPLRRLRKQPLELQGDEEYEDIPENIPEDSLVDILAAVHSRTSSTETIIVPETQQTNVSFLLQTPSHYRRAQRKKTLKMKTKLKK